MPETAGGTVRLRALSVVREGDEVVVGDPESGTFVTMPAVGGVVIDALRRGATLAEAAAGAEEFAGEPVDVPAFVTTLGELGFLDDGEDRSPRPTAPVQGRRWLAGVRPETARRFFGPAAWACYVLCAAGAVAVPALRPALRPDPAADALVFTDTGLSGLLLLPLALLAVAGHEAGHWLAARAVGVRSRFGVDRRMVVLVVETDLTQLWTVERRLRYGPLLAGLAVDAVQLAAALVARLLVDTGHWSPPTTVDELLAAWVLIKTGQMLYQCMVFLRTDLYAVLVNALGCRDLWRVKSLLLRRAFGRLTPRQTAELAAADPVDVRAGRWFRWVWLAGFAGVAAWFVLLVLPALAEVARWTADGLAEGPLDGAFWYRAACAVLLSAPVALPAALAAREAATALRSRRRP
ncbi:hypothetical protein [Streptomyces sp. MAR4 CNX-425]|uniref:hypothetical protein n=1 Tax=Streptomyces sp. MAR4 CNX-425 TaxID=3406343 RepID=UPI003B503081